MSEITITANYRYSLQSSGGQQSKARYFKKPGPGIIEGVNFREGSLEGNSERKEGRKDLSSVPLATIPLLPSTTRAKGHRAR